MIVNCITFYCFVDDEEVSALDIEANKIVKCHIDKMDAVFKIAKRNCISYVSPYILFSIKLSHSEINRSANRSGYDVSMTFHRGEKANAEF